jgi:RNAse (barnase) inhibitor barstar
MRHQPDARARENDATSKRSLALMSPSFIFKDDPTTFRDSAALIVRIPRGIRSKEKLFGIFADRLRLPNYFGWNWDALEECLRDLSWLPPTQSIAIVHEDLPFGVGGQNRAIYLELLGDFLQHWSQTDRKIHVIMPKELQENS